MLLALASAVFLGSESLGTLSHSFETFLFVASYDSQGHGGGIRPRLHTGSSQFLFPYSLISFRHGSRTENTTPLFVPGAEHTENTVSRVRLQVHWSVTSTGRGADDIENIASSIVACWTVFTELLPGNALIKSVNNILYDLSSRKRSKFLYWNYY
jgi:hypothetical protein